jgi:hypothetical protein
MQEDIQPVLEDEFFVYADDEEPVEAVPISLVATDTLPQKKERPVWTPEAYLKKQRLKPKSRTKEEWDSIFEFYPTTEDG